MKDFFEDMAQDCGGIYPRVKAIDGREAVQCFENLAVRLEPGQEMKITIDTKSKKGLAVIGRLSDIVIASREFEGRGGTLTRLEVKAVNMFLMLARLWRRYPSESEHKAIVEAIQTATGRDIKGIAEALQETKGRATNNLVDSVDRQIIYIEKDFENGLQEIRKETKSMKINNAYKMLQKTERRDADYMIAKLAAESTEIDVDADTLEILAVSIERLESLENRIDKVEPIEAEETIDDIVPRLKDVYLKIFEKSEN